MFLRLFLCLWLVVLSSSLAGCGNASEASRPAPQVVAFYVIAAPSGQQRTCQLQGELVQNVLLKVMRPGDSLRLAVGRKDVADFALASGVELSEAARRDKVGPQWQKLRQQYQAAVQYGGPDQMVDMAAVLPQVMEWASARADARKVLVLLGQPGSLPDNAAGARERNALRGVTVHVIDPESPLQPQELRQGQERLERSLAALGLKLTTFSTSPAAFERLRLVDDKPSLAPVDASQGEARLWRIRARWRNPATDYDLLVRQETFGEPRRFVSATSHQRNRQPRTWEEVSLATVSGAEVVELRLCSGPVDAELVLEVHDPDGRLVKSTVAGVLFQGRSPGDPNSATRTVPMSELLSSR